MKHATIAHALMLGGALAVMEVAAAEEAAAAGMCSVATPAAHMMVSAAAGGAAAATPATGAPAQGAVEEQPVTPEPAAAVSPVPASDVANAEPTLPPGSCGMPEKYVHGAAPSPAPKMQASATPVAAPASTPAPEPREPVAMVHGAGQMAPAPAPKRSAAPASTSIQKRVATAKPDAKASPPATGATAASIWWPAKVDDALNLVFAGEASFSPAIVLLFDGTFDDPALANKAIQVTSAGGKAVAGQWVVATNKRMLLFKAPPGHYRVKIEGSLVDSAGRKIAAAQGGPVTVAAR